VQNEWRYVVTKRVSICAAIGWACLLVFVIVVRAYSIELGSIQPEAVALTFMMTLPFTLGATILVIVIAWVLDRLRTA